jgi:hypothetical protein
MDINLDVLIIIYMHIYLQNAVKRTFGPFMVTCSTDSPFHTVLPLMFHTL